MLVIEPKSVYFADAPLTGVRTIAIERRAATLAEEWSDTGPHQMFCDATRVRTVVRVVQHLDTGDPAALVAAPVPGRQDQLRFEASMGNQGSAGAGAGGNRGTRRFAMLACVVAAATELVPGPLTASGARQASVAVRTITLHVVASAPGVDPVQVS
jgi:hypothetical protein